MWSREVMRQIKNIIFPLSQCVCHQIIIRSSHPLIRMTPQWDGLLKSCDKLNTLQKTHGHQTRQGADLPWEFPILKAKSSFDHVPKLRLCDDLKNSYLHSQELWPLNLAGLWLWGDGWACQRSSYHQIHVFIWKPLLLTINLWVLASYDFLEWLCLEPLKLK